MESYLQIKLQIYKLMRNKKNEIRIKKSQLFIIYLS